MTQRRNLLKALSIASVPVAWTRPVVNSVLLPAHGATSDNKGENGETPDAPCSASGMREYTESGTFDFTVPEGVCQVQITAYGGGGGGGASGTIDLPGGGEEFVFGEGGGDGGTATGTLAGLTAGEVLFVYVGAGGSAGDGDNGGAGGTTGITGGNGGNGGSGSQSGFGGGGGGGASGVVREGTAWPVAVGGGGGDGGGNNDPGTDGSVVITW